MVPGACVRKYETCKTWSLHFIPERNVALLSDWIQSWKQVVMFFVYVRVSFSDPRTKDWFLLSGSPIPVWCLTALYLAFLAIGPKLMRNRSPLPIQPFMFVYNMGCVALSVYMFAEVFCQFYVLLCLYYAHFMMHACWKYSEMSKFLAVIVSCNNSYSSPQRKVFWAIEAECESLKLILDPLHQHFIEHSAFCVCEYINDVTWL